MNFSESRLPNIFSHCKYPPNVRANLNRNGQRVHLERENLMIVPAWFHRRFLVLAACATLMTSMTCVALAQTPNASTGNGTASAPVKLLEPKPITPGHIVVTLFPPGHPALRAGKNFDKEEVMTGRNGRISNVTNIHNPSIELYLAPPEKAN